MLTGSCADSEWGQPGAFPALETLDLSSFADVADTGNMFGKPGLYGPLPEQWFGEGGLPSLSSLNLSFNFINGNAFNRQQTCI